MKEIAEGMSFDVPYPFIKDKFTGYDGEGSFETETWRPGTRYENLDNFGSVGAFADGHGNMLVDVVSVHKPGKYPKRVFFTRKWVDPAGKTFGKNGLHATTEQAFKRLLQGYRYEYELVQG